MNLKILICIATVFLLNLYNLSAQDQVLDINIACKDQVVNQSDCIEFTCGTIDQLSALQFTIVYDPTVLQFIGNPSTTNSVLTNLSKDNFDTSIPGVITFIWFQNGIDITIPNSFLFSLCFDYIGQPGESSLVSINSIKTEIEAVSEIGNVNVNIMDCEANVLPFGRSIITKYCNPTTMTSTDGSLCFYGIGGMPPYNYIVTNGVVIDSGTLNDKEEKCLSGLPKGTYTITMVDASNIVFTPKNVLMVDFDTNPKFDVEFKKPSCFYRNDGTMMISNVNVSTIESKIQWSNGLFNTNMQTDLFPGKYSVTVIDGNGCKTTKDLDLSVDTLKLDLEVIQPGRCKGLKDAQIKITGTGGTPNPLDGTYDATLTSIFSKLPTNPYLWMAAPSGKITIQLRDYAKNFLGNLNPCVVEKMIDVPYTDTIKFDEIIVDDIKCKGKSLGKVEVKFGGTGTIYTIIREANLLTNAPIVPGGGVLGNIKYINNELKAGKYYIVAKSNFNCLDSFIWEIKEPPTAFVVNAQIVQPNCAGGLGSIKLTPTGGQSPYTIKWSDGDTANEKNNLQPGDYKVTVTDFLKCDTIFNISLSTGGDPKPDANVLKAITCNGFKNGEVIVNIPGTGTAITYLWKNKSGEQWNTKIVTGLGFGTYYVTVTVDGCVGIDSTTLFDPIGLKITDVQIIQPECPKGGAKGSIGLSVDGGFPTYRYEWRKQGSPTVIGTQSVLGNLETGTYLVSIFDQNNCVKDTTILLQAPSNFNINVTNLFDVSCYGFSDGRAVAKASLGPINNGKYTFFWSNGQKSGGLFDMDPNFTLESGKNWVFVADTKCVSDTVFFNIGTPPAIITEEIITGICTGDCKGQIEVKATGGAAPPLVVSWPTVNGGEVGNVVYNLCIGSYPYQVKDGGGCIFKDTVVISAADTLKLAINESITEPLSCRNSSGQIGIDVAGGKPTYTFKWTGSNSISNIANNLGKGIYSVTVTDANGCTNELSYTLSSPNPIEATFLPLIAPDCFGGKTCIKVENVIGGTGNYTMQINNGFRIPIDSCLQLFSGKYLVSIYDGAGCKSDYEKIIPEKAPIEVDLGEDIKVNLGEQIEKIEPNINTEFKIINYNWQGLKDLACLDSLCEAIGGIPKSSQAIKLIVTDENGCTGIDEINVELSDDRNVFIPNIFNLSSDNETNSKFEVVIGFGVELVEEIMIFDRWGTIVHQRFNYIPDLTTGWDGRLGSQPALPGVYVFRAKVKFIDGVNKVYFGDVTLFK